MISARKALGLSQTKLAKEVGLPLLAIIRLEKLDYSVPKDPETLFDHAARIAFFLLIPIDEIVPEGCVGMKLENERSQVREFTHAEITDALSGVKLISAPVDSIIQANEQKEELAKIIKQLPERTAEVIRMRFGLDGHLPLTLDEIGKKLGISKRRVHEIAYRGVQRLKEHMRVRRYTIEDFCLEDQ